MPRVYITLHRFFHKAFLIIGLQRKKPEKSAFVMSLFCAAFYQYDSLFWVSGMDRSCLGTTVPIFDPVKPVPGPIIQRTPHILKKPATITHSGSAGDGRQSIIVPTGNRLGTICGPLSGAYRSSDSHAI